MTAALQTYLKETLLGCTDIPEASVYTELKEERAYQSTPYASILPEGAQIEPAWGNEQAYKADSGGYIKVLRKYRISQPWTVHIRRQIKEECTQDAEAFLAALHHKVILGGTVAELTPRAMEFLLASGAMDHYEARLSLTAEYGVYTEKQIGEIQSIKIEVTKNVE